MSFKVRYSQLDANELKKEVMKRYAMEKEITCRFFNSGLNDIYRINQGETTYYLRIALASMHNEIDYIEETEIIRLLAQEKISVAEPVMCDDGSYVWQIDAPEGTRYAVLFTEAKQSPSKNEELKMRNFGAMEAKLHQITDQHQVKVSRIPIDMNQLVTIPLQRLEGYLASRKPDYDFLVMVSQKLSQSIEQTIPKEMPYYGYCHGDLHSANVYFDGDTPKFFDFDCMGYGYRAYDICVYAWNQAFGNKEYLETKEWAAFMEGYNSVRTLNQCELDAIPAFIALRQLWLMGLHADAMERNAGCCWFNDGYFDNHIEIFKHWFQKVRGV